MNSSAHRDQHLPGYRDHYCLRDWRREEAPVHTKTLRQLAIEESARMGNLSWPGQKILPNAAKAAIAILRRAGSRILQRRPIDGLELRSQN